VAIECGPKALFANKTARADALGELFTLYAIFFALGAVGGVEK
jgi:hypothetical protein